MARHRCTRCKQEAYPRHKFRGGLFCEPCRGEVLYGRGFVGHGLWGRIWNSIKEFVSAPFIYQRKPDKAGKTMRVAFNAQQAKARNILMDARTTVPQKR